MKSRIKQKITIILILTICILNSSGCSKENSKEIKFVKEMGSGWNLGNSLEPICKDGHHVGDNLETYWKNPKTTKAMIDEISNAGFQTIRIPVTWYQHMDENGVIDPIWMDRVKEVVDYAIENDRYVILNTHHEDWTDPSPEKKAEAIQKMRIIWTQIGEVFKNYDEKLLFEGMNEPRRIGLVEEWNGGKEDSAQVVNELNQVFVDTIRSQDGNNKERYLLVTPYAGSILENAIANFKMPEGKNLILTIHAYVPYTFVMKEDGETTWKEDREKEIDEFMQRLYENFIKKGIPVIIGEFGAIDKGNTEERIKWAEYYVKKAKENKLMYIWWDEGGLEGDTQNRFRLFDRYTNKWLFPEIKDILIE